MRHGSRTASSTASGFHVILAHMRDVVFIPVEQWITLFIGFQ
jgi:hypothetical protein